MNVVQMTAKMYDCRDTAKSLYGDRYEQEIAEWQRAINKVAAAHKCDPLQAVIQMTKRSNGGMVTIMLLAAYVEMTEGNCPADARPQEALT